MNADPTSPEGRALARADDLLDRAAAAAAAFLALDQAAVDRIVNAVADAAWECRHAWAQASHDETGMGLVAHKELKNAWAARVVRADLAGRRTVGVLREDPARGLTEIARPRGPIVALTPVTNPVSTTICKALCAMKTRNPVVFSPHRGARKVSAAAAATLAAAAEAAGAPTGAIQSVAKGTPELLAALMAHPRTALILATGATGIVRAAQASGKPTYGAGPGNVPVYVHPSANVVRVARGIIHSKTFDHGTVCASEQAAVVPRSIDADLRRELASRGAFFTPPEALDALGELAFDAQARTMRAAVVGRPATELAAKVGLDVPAGTRLLVAEPRGVGREHPLSHEILAPILAWYVVEDHDEAMELCRSVIALGGVGHTAGIWASDEAVIADFAARVDAARILVDTPCTQGAIGGIFNALTPSLTLACGAGAGNVVAANVGVAELIEVRTVARNRASVLWEAVRGEVVGES